jgi:hypothetical protein
LATHSRGGRRREAGREFFRERVKTAGLSRQELIFFPDRQISGKEAAALRSAS